MKRSRLLSSPAYDEVAAFWRDWILKQCLDGEGDNVKELARVLMSDDAAEFLRDIDDDKSLMMIAQLAASQMMAALISAASMLDASD